MSKIFYKNITLMTTIIIIISFLLLPIMIRNRTTDINLLSISISSNYIYLVLNQLYILIIFKRIQTINLIYDKIICRIGSKYFLKKYIYLTICSVISYFILLYGIIYSLVGLPNIYIIPFMIFIIVNFSNFMIQELICLAMIGNKKNSKLIWLPIILNLVFHYIIANLFISFFI